MGNSPPDSSPLKKGLALKGNVQLDITRGTLRARLWPKKRPGKLHPTTQAQVEWFASAQHMAKRLDARQQIEAMKATAGTPLMPRDILTMILAGRTWALVQPDGKKVYSMQAMKDVSDSLDVLSQIPGSMLVRNGRFWEAFQPGEIGQFLVSEGPTDIPRWIDPPAQGAGGLIDVSAGIPPASQWAPINLAPGTTVNDQSTKAVWLKNNTNNNGGIVQIMCRPAIAAPSRVVTLMNASLLGNDTWYCVGFRNISNNRLVLMLLIQGQINMQYYHSPTSFGGNVTSELIPEGGDVCFGLELTDTQVAYQMSRDGVVFTDVYRENKATSWLGSGGYNQAFWGVKCGNSRPWHLTNRLWDENGLNRSFP